MSSQLIFTGIVMAVILQRLMELKISDRNAKYLLAHHGRRHHENALGLVKALQVAWFGTMLVEVWGFHRPFIPLLSALSGIALLAGQYLRYLSMQALGVRWTLPLFSVPGSPRIKSGIYRYLQHPNWLGVALETGALPLIHSAYLTAIGFSLMNGLLLRQRIKAEEAVLQASRPSISSLAESSVTD